MTLAVSLAMRRFLALLLLAALPLQGLAPLVTHAFSGDNGHGVPATLVQAQDGVQDAAAEDHSAPFAYDDTASCCLFAGLCHGSPGLIARLWSPLGPGFTSEPVPIALYAFHSFASEFPDRPPLAVL
jgi:hypothetical protein